MKKFIIKSELIMEAESMKDLINQIEIAKQEIRDDSAIAEDLLNNVVIKGYIIN